MDKNTIIAIVLSTVVVIAGVMIQPLLSGRRAAKDVSDVPVAEETVKTDEQIEGTSSEISEASDENTLVVDITPDAKAGEFSVTFTLDQDEKETKVVNFTLTINESIVLNRGECTCH